jgi:hypothetical protein
MTAPTLEDLSHNALLATLNEADRKRLMPHMMAFDMKAGDVLQEAGDEVVDTWFPCDPAMAAFCIGTNDNSSSVEVALIGREGAIGGIVSNGHVPSYATAEMLGVGRTFVTRVVKRLRDEGTIETRRGVFTIRNEPLLRTMSCACTTAIENHFDTVLHGIYPIG